MDFNYGEGVFKGIKDVFLEVKILLIKGIYQDIGLLRFLIFFVSFIFGEIKNERIFFKIKFGESINLRLNCRENFLLFFYFVKLEVRDVKGDCDVGDVVFIKMGGLESSLRNFIYYVVCEGLIISKCIFLLKFLLYVIFIKSW